MIDRNIRVGLSSWTSQERLAEIPVGWAVAMSSVMSQRLILNIRSNYDANDVGGSTSPDLVISDVAFKRSKRKTEETYASETSATMTVDIVLESRNSRDVRSTAPPGIYDAP